MISPKAELKTTETTQGNNAGLCLSKLALHEQGPNKSLRGPSTITTHKIQSKSKLIIGSILRPTTHGLSLTQYKYNIHVHSKNNQSILIHNESTIHHN